MSFFLFSGKSLTWLGVWGNPGLNPAWTWPDNGQPYKHWPGTVDLREEDWNSKPPGIASQTNPFLLPQLRKTLRLYESLLLSHWLSIHTFDFFFWGGSWNSLHVCDPPLVLFVSVFHSGNWVGVPNVIHLFQVSMTFDLHRWLVSPAYCGLHSETREQKPRTALCDYCYHLHPVGHGHL